MVAEGRHRERPCDPCGHRVRVGGRRYPEHRRNRNGLNFHDGVNLHYGINFHDGVNLHNGINLHNGNNLHNDHDHTDHDDHADPSDWLSVEQEREDGGGR